MTASISGWQRTKLWAYEHMVIGSLETTMRLAGRWSKERAERHDVTITRNIPYREGGGWDHQLDIYQPAGDGPHPVAVYIHGGGFQFFDRNTHWMMAGALARAGFLTFNISYRCAPQHPYPAAAEDAAAACVWVQQNAAQYGGDASRPVWAGESAGANLVLALTIASCYERPEPWAQTVWATNPNPAVILPACGYLEITRPERHQAERTIPGWMQGRIHRVSDAYLPDHAAPSPEHAMASPLTLLETAGPPDRPLPACLAVVGEDDPVQGDTLRLPAALQRLGAVAESKVYEGHHAFHALWWKEAAQQAWADQLVFIEEHRTA
jgi:acetyl esterase